MSYLPVSSNDTLSHLALPNSPETLCGKLAIDGVSASNYLTCDTCLTLSGGDSILKQTKKIEAGRECPYCQDGFDDTGHACWNCGGTGWLDEGDSSGFDSYLQGIDTQYPRGTKIAAAGYEPSYGWKSDGPLPSYRPDLSPEECSTPGCTYTCVPGSNSCSDHGAPDLTGTKIASAACVNCGSSYTKDGKNCADCGQPRDQANTRDMPQEGPNGIERIAPIEAPASPRNYDPVEAYKALSAKDESSWTACSGCQGAGCMKCDQQGYFHDRALTKAKPFDQDDRTDEVNRLRRAKTSRQSNVEKIATNWTRDGEAIENGFEVVISKEQAARTPFLDLTRVSVSEKRECPDCNQSHWLSKIASCSDCDGLKCSGCMETISLGGFLGTCKKCAGTESDDIYEADYEDVQDDQSTYLSYLMAEDEAEADTLFLPNAE